MNLSGYCKYLWNPFHSILIIVSMNLVDQLVILICDPAMEGYAPFGKGLVFGYHFCSIEMNVVV